MPTRLRRVLHTIAWIAGSIATLLSAATLYALATYQRSWNLPLPKIVASTDPSIVARGRYIVYGPGRCADCHVADADRERLLDGDQPPLAGGSGETTFIGRWTAPNLTPDDATGIGRISDSEIARMLRHGVNRFNRIGPPFMDVYANLAEDDVIAIVSYLRAQPPMRGVGPAADVNILGKLTLAFALKPYAPAGPPPRSLEPQATVEYGAYVARTLAGCPACHTARNLMTGTYSSPYFSGGLPFRARAHPGYVYVSPNLTPDSETGRIASWTEQGFVDRFRAGLLIRDSPMPWSGFQKMTDTDLRALYRFLHNLPAIRRDNGPVMQREHGQSAG
jgi:mono/diheme cytochrome c family protein